MRSFFVLAMFAGLSLTTISFVPAAGGGGQCGGGMQRPGGAQGQSSGNLSQAAGPSLLGPTQAYLQAAAAMSARQAQEREKRLTQHNIVYQKRREEAVAARQASLRAVRTQSTRSAE
jgi:hypothetical protein